MITQPTSWVDVGGPSFLTAKPVLRLLVTSKSFGGRNDDTDPPLIPLPTKGGEEKITGKTHN